MPLFRTFESKDKPFNVVTILESKKDSKTLFDVYLLNLSAKLSDEAVMKIHKQIKMFGGYSPAKDVVGVKTKYVDEELIKNILNP